MGETPWRFKSSLRHQQRKRSPAGGLFLWTVEHFGFVLSNTKPKCGRSSLGSRRPRSVNTQNWKRWRPDAKRRSPQAQAQPASNIPLPKYSPHPHPKPPISKNKTPKTYRLSQISPLPTSKKHLNPYQPTNTSDYQSPDKHARSSQKPPRSSLKSATYANATPLQKKLR